MQCCAIRISNVDWNVDCNFSESTTFAGVFRSQIGIELHDRDVQGAFTCSLRYAEPRNISWYGSIACIIIRADWCIEKYIYRGSLSLCHLEYCWGLLSKHHLGFQNGAHGFVPLGGDEQGAAHHSLRFCSLYDDLFGGNRSTPIQGRKCLVWFVPPAAILICLHDIVVYSPL